MVTEQFQFFARVRSFDFECPLCGAVSQMQEDDQDPRTYQARTALCVCSSCETLWLVGLYFVSPAHELLKRLGKGATGAAALRDAAPGRLLTLQDPATQPIGGPRAGCSSTPRRRPRKPNPARRSHRADR